MQIYANKISLQINMGHLPIRVGSQCVNIALTNPDGRMDGRYQMYYLPCFTVDNYDHEAS